MLQLDPSYLAMHHDGFVVVTGKGDILGAAKGWPRPGSDLDPESEAELAQCHKWLMLMGQVYGWAPHVLPPSPRWDYGSKQVT